MPTPSQVKEEILKEFWVDFIPVEDSLVRTKNKANWLMEALTRYAKACVPEHQSSAMRSDWPLFINEFFDEKTKGCNECRRMMLKNIEG